MIKVSIIIPYYKRFDNISLLFSAFARQSSPREEFEIVVGAMEFDTKFIQLCEEFKSHINVTAVLCDRTWCVSEARNMAIRQARGKVIVLLDADMLLPHYFVKNLYEQHFSNNQQHCVLGQMIDYDNNVADVQDVSVKPFSDYEIVLSDLESAPIQAHDLRWKQECNIPFSYVWTALVALPHSLVQEHALFFDENYKGYGVEDLEWGYRVSKTGVPIELKTDVWGLHLPHARSTTKNAESEKINYELFLKQVPIKAVELMCYLGDYEANKQYNNVINDIKHALPDGADDIGVALVDVDGVRTVCFGVYMDEIGSMLNLHSLLKSDNYNVVSTWPIIGVRVPLDDNIAHSSQFGNSVNQLPLEFRDAIRSESQRIAG